MDDEIPSIELKLKFQDIDNHLYFFLYFFLYLLIFVIISYTMYLYLRIIEKLNNVFWSRNEYMDLV